MEPHFPAPPIAQQTDPWARLGAYLAGEGTFAEREAFEQWVAEEPGRAMVLRRATEQWRRGLEPAPTDMVAAWERVTRRVSESQRETGRSGSRISRVEGQVPRIGPAAIDLARLRQVKRWGSTSVGIAAAAILVVIGHLARFGPPSTGTHVYRTAPGQTARVRLADGSQVVLASATTVVASTSVAGMAVTILGQALFVAQENAHVPFVVHTAGVTARVLGTTFVIRHYDTDRTTRVVVAEGRVSLASAHGGQRIVDAGFSGIADSTAVTVMATTHDGRRIAWGATTLVFDRVAVRDVLAELGRAYGVIVRTSDEALARETIVWGVDPADQTLAQALAQLSDLLDTRVIRTDHTFTLVPGRHTVRPATPMVFPLSQDSRYGR